MIFNLIMQYGFVPDVWKTAIVVPIYKKGPASNAKNYRPISLTCIGSKMFEKIVKSHLMSHLQENGLLSKEQHGFLTKRSTTANLLELTSDLSVNFNTRVSTLVAYVGLQKAFDKVSIAKLIHKIENWGIGGKLKSCISSVLTGRSQKVKVDGQLSDSLLLRSGVPQGGVLGPVIFTIYINDLPTILPPSLKSKIHADDFKCYSKVVTADDLEIFSRALHNISQWARDWQLPISTEKSALLLFSNSLELVGGRDLRLEKQMLTSLSRTLDLSVTFDSDLKFKSQISIVCGKAKQR